MSRTGKEGLFYPTTAEWATLLIEPVQQRVFRSEHVTEGKIAIDEDRSTPIFSPYAGRVTKLLVKPGDAVTLGQPLFTVEATDMVQAQNDFISAATALNKARSTLNLAQINDKRQRGLYEGKAVPLKEVQNAQATLDAAENDVRSAEIALEAARKSAADTRQDRPGDHPVPGEGHDQSGHRDLCPDRRNDRAAQGRTRAICWERHKRSGLHHR
jgi:cobalt-zinc-cadmium efflux system membrane fusion protein